MNTLNKTESSSVMASHFLRDLQSPPLRPARREQAHVRKNLDAVLPSQCQPRDAVSRPTQTEPSLRTSQKAAPASGAARRERAARLLASAGYAALAALPAGLMIRALSMTDLSHGWERAFLASWHNSFGGSAWAAAWVALFFWATPLLFKSVVFLISALKPKGRNPWSLTLQGLSVWEDDPRWVARLVSAILILLVTLPALAILVWHWASVEGALLSILRGDHGTPAGFAPLVWSFVTATIGLRMLGMAMTGNGCADTDDPSLAEKRRHKYFNNVGGLDLDLIYHP